MRPYRCFLLNHAGRIEKAEIVESDSDKSAVLAATALLDKQYTYSSVEVWDGARKVSPAPDRVDLDQIKRAMPSVGIIIA